MTWSLWTGWLHQGLLLWGVIQAMSLFLPLLSDFRERCLLRHLWGFDCFVRLTQHLIQFWIDRVTVHWWCWTYLLLLIVLVGIASLELIHKWSSGSALNQSLLLPRNDWLGHIWKALLRVNCGRGHLLDGFLGRVSLCLSLLNPDLLLGLARGCMLRLWLLKRISLAVSHLHIPWSSNLLIQG